MTNIKKERIRFAEKTVLQMILSNYFLVELLTNCFLHPTASFFIFYSFIFHQAAFL